MKSNQVLVAILLLAAGPALLTGQERPKPDSLQHPGPGPVEESISFSRPMPLIVPWLEQQQGFEYSFPTLLGPVSLEPYPLFTPEDLLPRPDLTASLRLQRAREESNRTLYAVLGSVQIGGVAYLAYQHIKKYGLFK